MAGDRQRRRQALYRLAAGQAGFFTAAQAIDLGYSYQAQKHHVDNGNWARVDRGIFRIPEWPPSLNDSFVRWVLWSKHRAVVSHDSAAVVHNLGLLNPAKVHLTVPQGFRMDDPVLALHRRQLPDADVMLLDGVVVTTVVRTVLDVIDSQFDEELVASVVDDALDKGAISERQLRRRLEELDSAERVRAERVLARKSRNVPVSAEPAALRLIGYWRSEFDENRWPDPKDFVDPTWSEAERNMVADHLLRGRTLIQYRGLSECRFCGEFVGSKELTDQKYCWPEGLAHYLTQHSVRLPDEFVSHVSGVVAEIGTVDGRAPEFDHLGQRLRGGGYDDQYEVWNASLTQLFRAGERPDAHPPNWLDAELDHDWWLNQVGWSDENAVEVSERSGRYLRGRGQ